MDPDALSTFPVCTSFLTSQYNSVTYLFLYLGLGDNRSYCLTFDSGNSRDTAYGISVSSGTALGAIKVHFRR